MDPIVVANESYKQYCQCQALFSQNDIKDSEGFPFWLTILYNYAEQVNNFKYSEHSIVLAIVLITKCSLKASHGTKSLEKMDLRRIKRKKNIDDNETCTPQEAKKPFSG